MSSIEHKAQTEYGLTGVNYISNDLHTVHIIIMHTLYVRQNMLHLSLYTLYVHAICECVCICGSPSPRLLSPFSDLQDDRFSTNVFHVTLVHHPMVTRQQQSTITHPGTQYRHVSI